MRNLLAAMAALFMGMFVMTAQAQGVNDPENTIYMELESGRVVIALRPDLAPNHVARIKELTREGFYDGIVFHRVIDGFMAQRSEEHTSELQSLMRISYAVFCLKTQKNRNTNKPSTEV